MKTFHDVLIYSGTRFVTSGSRLEISAKNAFLGDIFAKQNDCDRCKEETVLIFPEEDVTILKEAFDLLSHFKSSYSIIQRKYATQLYWYLISHCRSSQSQVASLPPGETADRRGPAQTGG